MLDDSLFRSHGEGEAFDLEELELYPELRRCACGATIGSQPKRVSEKMFEEDILDEEGKVIEANAPYYDTIEKWFCHGCDKAFSYEELKALLESNVVQNNISDRSV